MKSFLLPIVLASAFVNAAASASELQVIHSDDKARSCDISIKGKVVGTCSSLKFVKNDGLYVFRFDSEKEGRFGFFAIPVEVKKSKETTANIATFAVGRLYHNSKVKDLKSPGVCVVSELYKKYTVICLADGVEIRYNQ